MRGERESRRPRIREEAAHIHSNRRRRWWMANLLFGLHPRRRRQVATEHAQSRGALLR